MGVMRISAHSLTSDVGIGSRSHDLDGEDFRILSSSSSDTGVKEDRVVLVGLGLVIYQMKTKIMNTKWRSYGYYVCHKIMWVSPFLWARN